MKVIVSTHGRFHAFELARGLLKHDALQQLITPYPGWAIRKLVGETIPTNSATWIEVTKRISDKLKLGNKPDAFIGRKFANFASRTKMTGANIFVGWSNASLEAIPVARDAGLKIVIERGSSHIEHQTEVLRQGYQTYGLRAALPSAEVIEREVKEYEFADAITVPSQFAAKTFLDRGFEADKIIVNNYGVDLSRFRQADQTKKNDIPKILFVGLVGIRKGIPNLLKAFEPLSTQAELHLVGPIEPGFDNFLRDSPLENVVVNGAISQNELPALYQSADIFCLPSLEEGLPLVSLQALACGCPVVTTEAAAAADIIKDGENGIAVEDNSVAALNEALRTTINDSELRILMGAKAVASIKDGFSWEHYVDRAMMAYKNLLQ